MIKLCTGVLYYSFTQEFCTHEPHLKVILRTVCTLHFMPAASWLSALYGVYIRSFSACTCLHAACTLSTPHLQTLHFNTLFVSFIANHKHYQSSIHIVQHKGIEISFGVTAITASLYVHTALAMLRSWQYMVVLTPPPANKSDRSADKGADKYVHYLHYNKQWKSASYVRKCRVQTKL